MVSFLSKADFSGRVLSMTMDKNPVVCPSVETCGLSLNGDAFLASKDKLIVFHPGQFKIAKATGMRKLFHHRATIEAVEKKVAIRTPLLFLYNGDTMHGITRRPNDHSGKKLTMSPFEKPGVEALLPFIRKKPDWI